MKNIYVTSLLIGVLLGAAIVLFLSGAAATPGEGRPLANRKTWEYKVVPASGFREELGNAINSGIADGWEFVSASGISNENYGFVVLKREKNSR